MTWSVQMIFCDTGTEVSQMTDQLLFVMYPYVNKLIFRTIYDILDDFKLFVIHINYLLILL